MRNGLTMRMWIVLIAFATTTLTLIGSGEAAADVVYKIPLSPTLVGRVAGPDLLVGTLDDGFSGGVFNVLGSPGYIQWNDQSGMLVGFGAGTSEFTYLGTNDPVPLGNNTNFGQFNTGPGFQTIGIDDAGRTPHRVEIFSDHTYTIEYTFLSCSTNDPSCSVPLIETDLAAGGVWWNPGDNLDLIPEIKAHPLLGDLTGYAAFAQSISPVEASAFAITVISMPITSANVRGSLVTPSWNGGTVTGVQPFFFKPPVATLPLVSFDFEAQPVDTVEDGSLTSVALTRSGLTIQVTRAGGASFDVINLQNPSAFPGTWGSQALSPFTNQTLNDVFIATFSSPVGSVSIQSGDFGGDNSDLMFLHAFSGGGAGGALLDTDSSYWGNGDFNAAGVGDPPTQASVSSEMGIRSIIFSGGSTSAPHSLYYDNITVPEPGKLQMLSAGILILMGLFRNRACRQGLA